jgi:hypothetical protein
MVVSVTFIINRFLWYSLAPLRSIVTELKIFVFLFLLPEFSYIL